MGWVWGNETAGTNGIYTSLADTRFRIYDPRNYSPVLGCFDAKQCCRNVNFTKVSCASQVWLRVARICREMADRRKCLK